MYDAISTSTEQGFRQSSLKLALHLILYVAFVAGSIWLAWDFYLSNDAGFLVVFGCLVFFVVALVATVHHMLVLRGDVVIISPEGVHDLRLTKKSVPWNLIDDVSEWRFRGKSGSTIVLKINPDAEDSLSPTLYARLMRPYERALGIKGLTVFTGSLDIPHGRLLRLMYAYEAAAKKSDNT
ncbi:STM3941 family protein [Rhizobium sp. G187]|uniref:STM3941 family protein n=1 Tax=Rhizobium sp. G187 TaxID=3451352 RepID=UPI003EE6814F